MNNNKNGVLMIVLLIIVVILVLFFPKIHNFIISLSMPKVEELQIEEKEEKKEITEDILETIRFPLMRSSIYDINTYYSLDKFTIKDMSNNDILLNAFLDIHTGNITNYSGYSNCTNTPKQFLQKYIIFRIKNILGKEINYTLSNFYVPEDLDTNFKGNWTYDGANSRFIYMGLCTSRATNTKYYNLEQLIKMEYENDDINAYYYVGFAKVEGNNYIIYKDPKMTKELIKGTFTSIDNLNNIFKNLKNKNKQIYKYTFKDTLCKYNEYCLYEGKWIDEL